MTSTTPVVEEHHLGSPHCGMNIVYDSHNNDIKFVDSYETTGNNSTGEGTLSKNIM